MALSQDQISGAQNWLNTQQSGGYDPNGMWNPNLNPAMSNGVYNSADPSRNAQVLGAAQAMGYNNQELSQILGIPADQISSYAQQNSAAANSYASQYAGEGMQNTGGGSTINGGRPAQNYATSLGAPINFGGQTVNYGYSPPASNWNHDGNYTGLGLTSDIYGATNGLNGGAATANRGFTPSNLGSYVDPSISGAHYSLNSGVVQGGNDANNWLYGPNGETIAGWNAGGAQPGQGAPNSISAGYSWDGSKVVADPNSTGYSTDRSGQLAASTGSRYSPAQLQQMRASGLSGHAAAMLVGPPALNADGSARQIASGGGGGGGGGGGTPGAPGTTPGGYTPPGLAAYTRNPALDAQERSITTQFNQNLNNNILPGIAQQAVAAGGVGGSREGVAQGLAIGQSNLGLANALAGTDYTDYNNQMNRNLQQYQGNQQYALGQGNIGLGYFNGGNNYNLGLGGLQLTNQGQQMNFYQGQRGQDLTQAAIGAQLYGQGVQGPWNPLTSASNIYNQYTGLNSGTNSATSQGGGTSGALGGALAGYQLYNYGSH